MRNANNEILKKIKEEVNGLDLLTKDKRVRSLVLLDEVNEIIDKYYEQK